jgi:hypothetical protein
MKIALIISASYAAQCHTQRSAVLFIVRAGHCQSSAGRAQAVLSLFAGNIDNYYLPNLQDSGA